MKIAVIAPNISENISGEAIKAFQYVEHLAISGADIIIIAHARSRGEFEYAAKGAQTIFVEDDWLQKVIWNSFLFRPLITLPFFLKVRTIVKRLLAERADIVFHYLCPVSPILPRFPVAGARNVLGPVTGNIYYPRSLRRREPFNFRWRRLSHRAAQIFVRLVFRDKARFDQILISGGDRTRTSLRWAGACDRQFAFVADSGVSGKILQSPAIVHRNVNYRFVTNGRLVPHKGIDLSIRTIARSDKPLALDIFGKGPEARRLQTLIDTLGVGDRVAIRGWVENHDDLLHQMMKYRGFVFPSMAEANGIVVQEALAMGLPVICLNWGGPAMLTSEDTARRIEPISEAHIIAELAVEMGRLAEDPGFAARRAAAGAAYARARFGWTAVVDDWLPCFNFAGGVEKRAPAQSLPASAAAN